jgi:hypothetical protein
MNSFCERQGKSLDSIRFMLQGERIREEQTPQDVIIINTVGYGRRRHY